jgi:hypothetical protein
MGNRVRAVGEFFSRLADGDPVAVGIATFFLVLALVAALIVYKVHRDLKRDDERQARRYGHRPPR